MSNILTVDSKDLDKVSTRLAAYIQLSKKSEDEVLNKKGNDLRIQLFRGFWKQKWQKGRKGGGFRLLRTLSRAGKGILVRAMSLKSKWEPQIPDKDKRGRPLNFHQKLVAQEVLRREAGVGILGVSFLRKRWRYKKEGRYLTQNTTKGFGKAVTFEKREGAFIITGFTPGLAAVATKYGIISGAIRKVAEDIDVYLERKLGPEFRKTLVGL